MNTIVIKNSDTEYIKLPVAKSVTVFALCTMEDGNPIDRVENLLDSCHLGGEETDYFVRELTITGQFALGVTPDPTLGDSTVQLKL